jgi:hypothetical protein
VQVARGTDPHGDTWQINLHAGHVVGLIDRTYCRTIEQTF